MANSQDIEQAIRRVKDQSSFVKELLIGALEWPIEGKAIEIDDISFEWSADELRVKGLDTHLIEGKIRQIQPFEGNPWGIFILEFKNPEVFTEGRGMTGVLRTILRGLVPSQRKAAHLKSFGRENLLFICNHNYEHYRFAQFKAPEQDSQIASIAAFGWGPGDAIRTVCEHQLKALTWPSTKTDRADWISTWGQAFDVEKVTQRFYGDYADIFGSVERLIGKENGIKGEELRMFTQTLFNRLMFLRFIERKGWLKFGKRKDYLKALYEAGPIGKKSFYQGRLRPLFFKGLAVEGEQKHEAFGEVPFLNGGLFEESGLDSKFNDIPDSAFAGIISPNGLFYRYNFTVEESTPLDIEVAVDPEMLGKVFEELVTGRHDSGSYYTPRPIVSFMCREALKGYLTHNTTASADSISKLVDLRTVDGLSETHARKIIRLLDDIKAVETTGNALATAF